MNNIISFGKHEGKTFEWLFFNKPWYAEWMYDNRIHRDEYKFSEDEGDYFKELFTRACHLNGTCRWCKKRPFTRMGLTRQYGTGVLSLVSFYCEECKYNGSSPTTYRPPSFFIDDYRLARCERLMIVEAIKHRYIGGYERLTQQKMEEFFHEDANFALATPGFFARKPKLTG